MNYLSLFVSVVSWVNDKVGKVFVCYLTLLMFFLLLFEIVARYVFSSPTVWATELTQMLFGAFIMLSGGYLMMNKGHIYVEIIYERFSLRTKALVDLLTSFLFFAFVLVLLKEGWYMAEDSISRLESSNSAWDPAIWPLKLCIPIGTVLLLFQGLAKIVQDLQILCCPNAGNPGQPIDADNTGA
jgi:TRAP-type mannitol/chloroaromatic compound transport system permease small subunit